MIPGRYVCLSCQRAIVLRRAIPGTRSSPRLLSSTARRPRPEPSQPDDIIDSAIANILSNTAASSSSSPPDRSQPGKPKLILNSHPFRGAEWYASTLRPAIIEAIQKAFPTARTTIGVQAGLLERLNLGYSVCVRDAPGYGKSFAIAAWLLSLERATRWNPEARKHEITTTALVLAPNKEMCEQYRAHIMAILEATGSERLLRFPRSFVQVLYRSSEEHESLQLLQLARSRNPHIIVATPTMLLDILSNKDAEISKLVDHGSVRTIIAEELDGILDKLPDVDPSASGRTLADRISAHAAKPDPMVTLLNYILTWRKLAFPQKQRASDPSTTKGPVQPQLVFPTNFMEPEKMQARIQKYYPAWFPDPPMKQKYTPLPHLRAPARQLVAVDAKHTTRLPGLLKHHILTYDTRSHVFRDAALPALGPISNQAPDIRLARDPGHPPEIGADIIEGLLELTSHPAEVIVFLSSESSKPAYVRALVARGIDAKILENKAWHLAHPDLPFGSSWKLRLVRESKAAHQREQARASRFLGTGRLPLGPGSVLNRLDETDDMKLDDKGILDKKEPGQRAKVWVTGDHEVRGLDVPGIEVGFVLCNVKRPKQYVTFAGRVRGPGATIVTVLTEGQTISVPLNEERDADDKIIQENARVTAQVLRAVGVESANMLENGESKTLVPSTTNPMGVSSMTSSLSLPPADGIVDSAAPAIESETIIDSEIPAVAPSDAEFKIPGVTTPASSSPFPEISLADPASTDPPALSFPILSAAPDPVNDDFDELEIASSSSIGKKDAGIKETGTSSHSPISINHSAVSASFGDGTSHSFPIIDEDEDEIDMMARYLNPESGPQNEEARRELIRKELELAEEELRKEEDEESGGAGEKGVPEWMEGVDPEKCDGEIDESELLEATRRSLSEGRK